MKIRSGFVSNSSSCSFVCHLCGDTRFGWDWDLGEEGYPVVECNEGHIICRSHLPGDLKNVTELPSHRCPFCSSGIEPVHDGGIFD